MAARDERKATAAIERLHKEGLAPGNGTVTWLKLDLADPRLAKQAAEEFIRKEKRLDVLSEYLLYSHDVEAMVDLLSLVNNAAMWVLPPSLF